MVRAEVINMWAGGITVKVRHEYIFYQGVALSHTHEDTLLHVFGHPVKSTALSLRTLSMCHAVLVNGDPLPYSAKTV